MMTGTHNILVPSVPPNLRITQTMWEDFVNDPALAAEVLMGYRLDAFQSTRLKYYWWVPQVIDSSGTGSGKTLVVWIWAQLRCILLPERTVGIFYQTFETAKGTFWDYYRKCRHPFFLAQCGDVDDDDKVRSRGASCFRAFFRSGSLLSMPAPSMMRDAETQESTDYHDILIEEWTRAESMGNAIDGVLKGRARAPVFNRQHPVWTNHILMSAHAMTRMHKGWKRVRDHERMIERGHPGYANVSFSHKDFSNLTCHSGKTFQEEYRAGSTIESEKLTARNSGDWLGKGLGIWGISGLGWFSEEALLRCIAGGRQRHVLPLMSRSQVRS